MVRLSVQRRRRIIVNGAKALARRDGLEAVNFERVARECVVKTSASTVRYHFPSIDDLLLFVCAGDDPELRAQGIALGVIDAD